MKTASEDTSYLLNANDRCDACPSQAYVYVELELGDFLFCLHHWNKHKDKLSNHSITEIVDESARLVIR
jgi:hypothetical protein